MEQVEPNIGMGEALGEHATNPATPRQAGEVIRLYEDCETCRATGNVPSDVDPDGVCPDCQGAGKSQLAREEYVVPSLEQRIKAQFEMWVRASAKREAIAFSLDYNQDMGQRALDAYIGSFGGGAYNWDGRHCRNARDDEPGRIYLLFLLLRRSTPLITLEEVEDIWAEEPNQCFVAMRWALGNSRSRRKAGTKETNGKATSSGVETAGAVTEKGSKTIPPSSAPKRRPKLTLDAD